jgi:competence protein ComEA
MPITERDYMRDELRPGRRGLRVRWLGFLVVTAATVLLLFWIWPVASRDSAGRGAALPFESKSLLVDVNSASLDELDALPYVSERVALAIVEGRPYERPEDLLRVRGIGPKILERIRPHIWVVSRQVEQPPARGR